MNLSITKHVENIDIVTAFQEVARLNIPQLEDAGCGMLYNLTIPIFEGMDNCIVQVYPYNKHHKVWILVHGENGEYEDIEINDLPKCVQTQILKNYVKILNVSHMVDIS